MRPIRWLRILRNAVALPVMVLAVAKLHGGTHGNGWRAPSMENLAEACFAEGLTFRGCAATHGYVVWMTGVRAGEDHAAKGVSLLKASQMFVEFYPDQVSEEFKHLIGAHL